MLITGGENVDKMWINEVDMNKSKYTER